MSASSKRIRITGAPALVLIAALGLFAGLRLMRAGATLDEGGREVVRQWLASEYARYQLARDDLTGVERAPFLLASDSIVFRSLTGRGRPGRTVVRVEVAPNAAQPPGTPMVRYFRLRYSTVTGWRLEREVSVLSYYLPF